jgi:bifunctional polynucleotide phosphatase/kinase
MSKFYAPIDEKWLDRPRAKRDSESDSATPKMKRQRSGKQDESSSDEDVDLLVEFQKQKQQKQESADNDNSEKDGDRQKKPSGSGQTSRPAKSSLNQASSDNRKTKETTCSIPSTPEEETNATKKSSSDGPSAEPIKKKQKIAAFAQQTNLFDFFSSSGPAKPSKPMPSAAQSSTKKPQAEGKQEQNIKESTPKNSETATDTTNGVPDSMIPEVVATPRNVVWNSVQENVIVRRVTDDKPRDKVAAFDLDGTLTVWRIAGWPSRLEHYELWSSTVPAKLRALYDEGFKLVLFTNQGAIQSAHAGKKATLNKYVINWIAHLVDRPVHAVLSTRSLKTYPNSFHKPTGKMWPVAIQILNKRQPFSVKDSFFVGDSADLNDSQGGVDLRFAQAVSKEHGAGSALSFYSPTEYFGPSDAERRSQSKSAPPPPPKEALAARAALLGGYHAEEPIMLLLCGVQGSGKSTFCNLLVDTETKHWVHLSQDTINNGKPGKREKVEDESKAALQKGKSVVIDRMHLDQEQRSKCHI